MLRRLVPGIHVLFRFATETTWMAGTGLAMTNKQWLTDFRVQFSRAPIPVSTRKSGLD